MSAVQAVVTVISLAIAVLLISGRLISLYSQRTGGQR